MLIKGLQKTSLIDYSPYVSAVIFTGNCNFKCGFCHNPDLVLNFKEIPTMDEKEVLDFLEKRKKWLDGVCITGGEPCIHDDLPEFLAKIKKLGYLIKLDTNGSNPDMLKKLIDKKLVDYIAMDIKAPLEMYKRITNAEVNLENIHLSIERIVSSNIDYEFRTTVVPGLVGKKEIFLISKWLRGCKKYVIQDFRATRPLIDQKLQNLKPFQKHELEEMKKIAEEYFDKVEIRE